MEYVILALNNFPLVWWLAEWVIGAVLIIQAYVIHNDDGKSQYVIPLLLFFMLCGCQLIPVGQLNLWSAAIVGLLAGISFVIRFPWSTSNNRKYGWKVLMVAALLMGVLATITFNNVWLLLAGLIVAAICFLFGLRNVW